ncbi:hypothetical protein Tco_1453723 [Tanacetum coccineum]
MNSPPIVVLQSCNQNPSTQNIVSSQNPDEKAVRIIPDPVCIVQAANMRKIIEVVEGRHECVLPTQEYIRQIIEDVSDDDDFTRGPWVNAVQYLNTKGAIPSGYLGDIKSFKKSVKLEMVVVIKFCRPNAFREMTFVTLIHTLEEESRAEQEWHNILMQQQESDEEHEKQLFKLYV